MVLFPRPPIIRFVSEKTVCHCGKELVVQKTRRKTVLSMTGPFVAHETLLNCPSCSTIFDSDSLLQLVPILQKLQKNFGKPQACVHDMGKGICKAISEVFPGTPDFICHFHFLRDTGKDFLEPVCSSLRSCLRNHKTSTDLHALAREVKQLLNEHDSDPELLAEAFLSGKLPENTDLLPLASVYSMTLWIVQGKHSGDGYGFPFDRPLLTFAKRLQEMQQYLPELLACFHDTDKIGKKSVIKLTLIVSDIINDILFKQGIKELNWRCKLFDSLRKAMRIALPDGKKGLNDDGTDEAISTICASVQRFRSKLNNNAKWAADKLCRKMAKQIDK